MQGIDSKDLPQQITSSFCFQVDNQQHSQSVILSQLQNSIHSHQKQVLLHEIQNVKRQHIRQIQSLKLSQHLAQSTFNFNIQQLTIKYDEVLYENDCLRTQNSQLREQVMKMKGQMNKSKQIVQKYETKIKNQEDLIDQYKRSIQEQIGLQKEVIRVQYMQRQLANKMNFQKALQSMEQNYLRKIEQRKYESTAKNYQTDMKQIKKLCNTLTKNKLNQNSSFLKNKENPQTYDSKTTQKKQKRQIKLNEIDLNSNTNVKSMKNSSSYSTIEK